MFAVPTANWSFADNGLTEVVDGTKLDWIELPEQAARVDAIATVATVTPVLIELCLILVEFINSTP
jgi:hypothetical protein